MQGLIWDKLFSATASKLITQVKFPVVVLLGNILTKYAQVFILPVLSYRLIEYNRILIMRP